MNRLQLASGWFRFPARAIQAMVGLFVFVCTLRKRQNMSAGFAIHKALQLDLLLRLILVYPAKVNIGKNPPHKHKESFFMRAQ